MELKARQAGRSGRRGPAAGPWRSPSGPRSRRRPPGSPGRLISLRDAEGRTVRRRADRRGQGTAGAARMGPEGPAAVSVSWGSQNITGDARKAAGDLRRQLQEIRSSGPRRRMCPIRTQQGRQREGLRRQLRKIRSSGQGAAGDVGSCGPCWRSPARPCSSPRPNRA